MKSLKYDDFMTPFKGNAAINLRPKLEEYKRSYFEKYAKDILVSCVYNDRYDRYTFFFKFPSGENDKYPTAIMYDIVLEFNPPKNEKNLKHISELTPYEILMFSNSPSFIFTFDYVIKHTYGFPHCIGFNHLSKVAISKAPEMRNTLQIMTLEKSTWMCFFHLVHNGYMNKEMCKTIMSDKPESFFAKKVDSQPMKLKEIDELKKLMKEEKLADKQRKTQMDVKKNYNSEDNKKKNPMAFSFKIKNDRKMRRIMKHNNTDQFKANMHKSFKVGGKQ